jgi:hypothetical protein
VGRRRLRLSRPAHMGGRGRRRVSLQPSPASGCIG